MIRRLTVSNFKAFEKFTLHFRGNAFLVGPNNAGKSTVIAALRASANMLRLAASRTADYSTRDGDRSVLAYAFSGDQARLVEENLRYELRDEEETRLDLTFKDGASLHAVWPPDNDPDERTSFFYLRNANDVLLHRPKQVREQLPAVGIVPILAPIDHEEDSLTSDAYVRANFETRLASRHFRNQLRLLQREREEDGRTRFAHFKEWSTPWLTGFELGELEERYAGSGMQLDLFYREPGSRLRKEAFWAGDGMQVWLQILLHIYRLRSVDTVVLDEPDVYLHADLQRRLVQLVESSTPQTITATHSAEVLAEADPEAVMWVSRERKQAVRAPTAELLFDLSDSLGTVFNLKLARAIRARTVLFVEGEDIKILRDLARRLGADRIVQEANLAVVSLKGFSNWSRIEPFQWLLSEFLEESVHSFVILDRDFRSEAQVSGILTRFAEAGIDGHIWERKELESYLLHPEAISRISGAPTKTVLAMLGEAANELANDVQAQIAAERDRELRASGLDYADIHKAARAEFDELWSDPQRRVHTAPAKPLIAGLNRRLTAGGFNAVTPRRLARTLRASEIPEEMQERLLAINQAV